jgi:two-component system OmpR family sensor kinase
LKVEFGVGRSNASRTALRTGLARFGRHLRRGAPAYAVLIISLVLTALASWYYVRQSVEAQNRARFEETTRATKAAIYRRVKANLDAMFGARGLFLGSDSVERTEWDAYVKSIEPQTRLEGLQSLGFAKFVRPGERVAYSREAREEGVRDLWPEPGDRSAYFPLEFVAPSYEANRRMVGYDAYSDPANRSVMDRARDTASPQATMMDYVLTDASSHPETDSALEKGFVVYLPVYQEDLPAYQKGEPRGSVAERRRTLRGFIVGTFKADELFAQTFGRTFHPAIDFEVYDGEDVASSSLLYDNNGVRNAGEKGNAASRRAT